MGTPEHAVVIVGGGPTGLMLAGELALAGVDAASSSGVPNRSSRALAWSARPHDRGARSARGRRALRVARTGGAGHHFPMPLDISDFPTRHPYGLALWREPLRGAPGSGWASSGCRPSRVRGDGLHAGRRRCRRRRCPTGGRCGRGYLVGCDGGRSLVRKGAGIGFPGVGPPRPATLIAEARSGRAGGGYDRPRRHRRPRFGEVGPSSTRTARCATRGIVGPVRVMVTEQQLALGGRPLPG